MQRLHSYSSINSEDSVNEINSPHPDLQYVYAGELDDAKNTDNEYTDEESLSEIEMDAPQFAQQKSAEHTKKITQKIVEQMQGVFGWFAKDKIDFLTVNATYATFLDHPVPVVNVQLAQANPIDPTQWRLPGNELLKKIEKEFLANYIALHSLLLNENSFYLPIGQSSIEYKDDEKFHLSITLSLSYHLLVNMRKNSSGFRIDAIDHQKKLGEGGQGAVWEIASTYKTNDKGIFEVIQSHPLAVKLYVFEDEKIFKQCRQYVEKETVIGRKVGSKHKSILHAIHSKRYHSFSVQHSHGEHDLRDILDENKLTTDERIVFCENLARIVLMMHFGDIVHKDIKPENILIKKNNMLALVDFYSSKFKNEDDSYRLGGTVDYQAPEVADIKNLQSSTPESDRYSVGKVIDEIMFKFFKPNLSVEDKKEIKQLIQKLTSSDPKKRPGLRSVIDFFRRFRHKKEDQQSPPSAAKCLARKVASEVDVLLLKTIKVGFENLSPDEIKKIRQDIKVIFNKLSDSKETIKLFNTDEAMDVFIKEAHLTDFFADKNCRTAINIQQQIDWQFKRFLIAMKNLYEMNKVPDKSLDRLSENLFSMENLEKLNCKLEKDLAAMHKQFRIAAFTQAPFGLFLDKTAQLTKSFNSKQEISPVSSPSKGGAAALKK